MIKVNALPRIATTLVITLLLISSSWVAWDNWGRFLPTHPPATTELRQDASVLARGEYLAQIGGCTACHLSPSGAALAGGRRIDTPFGAVFSSNLTPSKAHGLGDWSLADFQNALRWGRSRNGRLLLPVFPYNHTSALTDEDVQAIFTWLQTVPPIDQAQPAHRLTWPFGTQPVIAVWRSLFFKPTSFTPNPQATAQWNRGAYLVQSAGHCATCHGHRGSMGAFPAVDDLSGGVLSPQMWLAPSLVDASQTATSRSTPLEIAHLLRDGQNPYARVSGPMAEFVQHTGQHLSESDALAMAVYLKSRIDPTKTKTLPPTAPLAQSSATGQAIYSTHCASCHGQQGEGKAEAYPALAGNPAVAMSVPDNLIQMTLYGGYGPSTPNRPRPHGMPPYLFKLNNQQIAEVLNHIRSQWGNQAEVISPMQVDRIRAAVY
jgi:mono/diheme cytochrome c family protein